MFWTTAAYAMGATPQGAEGGLGALGGMLPIVGMFAIFYFLLIRPQQKKAKEHQSMLKALKRGDKVVTSGGLYGKIVEAGDETVVLDLGETKVTVGRAFIAGVPGPAKPAPEKKAKKEDPTIDGGNNG